MADDIDALLAWAKSQGFEVRTDKKGYRRIFSPAGEYIVRHPATPGNSRRRYTDVVVALRSAGLAWPPPSKKEQRSERTRKESS